MADVRFELGNGRVQAIARIQPFAKKQNRHMADTSQLDPSSKCCCRNLPPCQVSLFRQHRHDMMWAVAFAANISGNSGQMKFQVHSLMSFLCSMHACLSHARLAEGHQQHV